MRVNARHTLGTLGGHFSHSPVTVVALIAQAALPAWPERLSAAGAACEQVGGAVCVAGDEVGRRREEERPEADSAQSPGAP